MLLTEFNEKKFAKTMWKEGHKDILTIMDEINNGNNTLEKLTALGFDA